MSDAVREQNRQSWNAATRAHNSHKDDQAEFLRQGGSTLFDEELDLLGPLRGLRLLHLQCNAGQDSLSLAAHGADVVGVDISDDAIDFACKLSRDSGIAARFERDDVDAWLARAAEARQRFDRVFASYGAIPWLADLDRWSRGIAGVLAPGGRVVLVEFHPAATMFDEAWRLRYPYRSSEGRHEQAGVGDYVADSGDALAPSGYRDGIQGFRNPHPCHEYFWSPADVVRAWLAQDLILERFEEYPHSNGARMWQGMRPAPGRRWLPPAYLPAIPLMYGLAARRDRE